MDENGNIIDSNITKKDVINALVCGENEENTDTMMYVRYYVKTGKLAYMSIPRDTYVEPKNYKPLKLNSLYRIAGIETLVEEVEKLLDVNIDYYLVIGSKIVREVVDIVGGVEIDVPIRMKYDDGSKDNELHIDLQPGVQILDGNKAEQFIRFRKGNPGYPSYKLADIDRVKAQQQFIKAFIKTLTNPANIIKAPDVIKAGFKNTVTNVTVREALKYVTDIPNVKLDNIYSCTAPGTTPYINNISYFKMNIEETKKILDEHFTDIIPEVVKQDDLNVNKIK
ncbi:MAG: LCP family protein [Clostridia bacterium]